MEEEQFRQFMEKTKKPAATINSYINSVNFYADYLHSHRQIHTPDEARPVDLQAFVSWGTENGENVYRHLWGLRTYYEFLQHSTMVNTANERMEYLQNETRKLSEFPDVDRESIKRLSAVGITTVNQLLRAGNSPEKLAELSEKSGASQATIMELYKLSNLSRLPGVKKVRARLFCDGGLDTLTKIAAREPEEVQRILQDYIDETGFEARAPSLSEAQVAVTMARFLPQDLT
jgi:Domain of unknown function (DUF4332)